MIAASSIRMITVRRIGKRVRKSSSNLILGDILESHILRIYMWGFIILIRVGKELCLK